MGSIALLVAYLGPETMLPMTSVVAGVIGVVMMFGRNSLRWVMSWFRKSGSKPMAKAAAVGKSRRIGTGPVQPVGVPQEKAENRTVA